MENPRFSQFAEKFCKAIETNANGAGQKEVADMLGTNQSIISRVKKGLVLPSDEVVIKMRDLWGCDLIEELRSTRKENRYNAQSPSKSYKAGVPYYNVDFLGGFDLIFNDQTTNPDYYINFKPYEKATCWCNITGHSMEPEINHGDIIALRAIEDWSFLPYGEIYAIVTRNDMRTVKRLGPGSSSDTYTLIPSNKSSDYAPQEINKKDILHVFEVMGCMKRF